VIDMMRPGRLIEPYPVIELVEITPTEPKDSP